MLKDTVRDQLPDSLKDLITNSNLDSDTLVEAAKQLEQSRTFVEGGSINARSLFRQAVATLVYLTHVFISASDNPTDSEARRLVFSSFTVGFSGTQVRSGKATVRTTDGRELELQPYLRQLMDAIGVKTIGTPQTTIIQLALCIILLHGHPFDSALVGSIPCSCWIHTAGLSDMRRVVVNKCGKARANLDARRKEERILLGMMLYALETDIPADHMNAGLDAMLRDGTAAAEELLKEEA